MPIATRPARALLAACLAAAAIVAALPVPAALGLEPPRPLPDYRPAFVTETDTRPWTDCLWASGAMLLDKWTNGRTIVSRQALRAASGDHAGGSTFDDLRAGFAAYGFRLRFSPDGGERVTWGRLLWRLEHGAGAVLLGDYASLPRWYGRWDARFWKKEGEDDNHAVYIERYDRRHNRVWLMDPLGRNGYAGEWINASVLRRYAWSRGGALFAAVTPTARPAPFAGVRAGDPVVARSSDTLEVAWPLEAPARWRFSGADVQAAFVPAEDPLGAAATSLVLATKAEAAGEAAAAAGEGASDTTGSGETDAGPAPGAALPPGAVVGGDGRVSLAGTRLVAVVRLPATPGAWTTTVTVTDRRFGEGFASAAPLAVFVPGERRATLRVTALATRVAAGGTVDVEVSAANTGTRTWADEGGSAGGSTAAAARGTRLVGRWIRLGNVDGAVATADARTRGALPVAPVEIGAVPLAPGGVARLAVTVPVPAADGRWALVVDVIDAVDGSFAALGSAPAVLRVEVVPARGITPVD